jgi:hypothetical protein
MPALLSAPVRPTATCPPPVPVSAGAHAWPASSPDAPSPAVTLASTDRAPFLQERARAHARARRAGSVLVLATPPGSGKSFAIAQLGVAEWRIAWIAERHDMVTQVPVLGTYRQIAAPTAETCPHWLVHAELASRGYKTRGFHAAHRCPYWQLLRGTGSAVYMVPHVVLPDLLKDYDLIVIDELDLSRWHRRETISVSHLRHAAAQEVGGSPAQALLATLADVVGSAARDDQRLDGRAVLQVLDVETETS